MICDARLKDIKKMAESAMFHCGDAQTKFGTPFAGKPIVHNVLTMFDTLISAVNIEEQPLPYNFVAVIRIRKIIPTHM